MAILWESALLLALIYVPLLQELFGTLPLDPFQWLVITGAAFSIVPVLAVVKWWSVRRRPITA
jgi:Ca2+-transporting ATPase